MAQVVRAIEARKRARAAILASAAVDIQLSYRDAAQRIRGISSGHAAGVAAACVDLLRCHASEVHALHRAALQALDAAPRGVVATAALTHDLNSAFSVEMHSREEVGEFIAARVAARVAQLMEAQFKLYKSLSLIHI